MIRLFSTPTKSEAIPMSRSRERPIGGDISRLADDVEVSELEGGLTSRPTRGRKLW